MDHLFYDPAKATVQPPNVDGCNVLIAGVLRPWKGASQPVVSPVRKQLAVSQGQSDEIVIGQYAMVDAPTALEALDAALKAYDHGRGAWARMKAGERIAHVKKFGQAMKNKREELAHILMWEICKSRADAEKEVDRTVQYITDTIAELTKMENQTNGVVVEQGIVSQTKRSPLGVALVAAPQNYPLNEFATLFIPAVIMGNTIVFKTPRVGGLVHMPLLEAYRDCFPPGVVNVVHGSGRECFTPVMKQGGVSILAFIGTHSAAQSLHQAHPHPFTVRLALGLDAKNPAIVTSKADLDVAASEIVLGALSYNGQRCTAIKITFVHESVADELVKRVKAGIEKLVLGLPWDKGVGVTPVAEPAKPKYHADVIADAVAKGATVVTGNKFDRTLCAPTLLYPCTVDMRICVEEQFGPVVPIVRYKNEAELESYFIGTEYGQQASVFTTDATEVPRLLDFLAHHVTRIKLEVLFLPLFGSNLFRSVNAQCQRGPDSMPFSGRKISATGTLSLYDALRTMSIRVAVATKQNETNVGLFQNVFKSHQSNTLSSDVLISNF